MRKFAFLLVCSAALAWTSAQAQDADQNMRQDTTNSASHAYVGIGATSLGLDNDRVPGVPTSSPGHSPKIGSLILGYQFNELWAADISLGTDFSDNVDTDVFAVNGYRFFGSGNWRPYLSAGLSAFSIDDASDDSTEQAQAGIGVSGNLNRNLELRVGYQSHFTISGDSQQDDAVGASLAWHFRQPQPAMVAEAQPEAQPESVPQQKEVVETIELRVLFEFDKSKVKSVYAPQFREIAQALKDNGDQTITIEGHTDSIGTDAYNQDLSQRRADAVKQELVKDYGIDPTRLDTKGYGERRPVADNGTAAGRQKNRRAVAVIMQSRTVSE